MSDLLSYIGDRLRSMRKEKGISQEELADRASVHFSYIGKLERGEVNATIESLNNISRALEVPLEELFRYLQPVAPNREGHTLALIVNRLYGRSIEDQQKVLQLLELLFQWKDES